MSQVLKQLIWETRNINYCFLTQSELTELDTQEYPEFTPPWVSDTSKKTLSLIQQGMKSACLHPCISSEQIWVMQRWISYPEVSQGVTSTPLPTHVLSHCSDVFICQYLLRLLKAYTIFNSLLRKTYTQDSTPRIMFIYSIRHSFLSFYYLSMLSVLF